ncbi:MAG TPA: PhoH family protein [Planctomycetota bacterium]|nr:PhoH family protein [Planctomycetota bacterium]
MDVTVPLLSPEEERALMGPHEAHARAVRNRFGVSLDVRRGRVHIEGEEEEVSDAARAVRALLAHLRSEGSLDEKAVSRLLENGTPAPQGDEEGRRAVLLPAGVEWRTPGQERFVRAIDRNTLTFAIGPAGTGKTFLAAAYAVAALRRGHFRKLVLVRPAVEAGEHLGFLPGDYVAKINPYLRPLYDALSAHLEPGKLKLFLDTDVIEIAPLAYMRGRTLDEAFIILDEAQNTTIGQMKMFLTRMGRSSKVVVTGDTTQVDLPSHQRSGLVDAQQLLRNVAGIGMVALEKKDIVRHPLVQKVVDAYEQRDRASRPEGFGPQ